MIKLKIADILILAEGFDNEYFIRRTRAYASDFENADMSVSVSVCDKIEPPSLEAIAVRGERFFCETETEYIFYDMHNELCVACIWASKDWTSVRSELLDVSNIGGAPTDVRMFNMLGEVFKYRILNDNGIVYHSSCILYNNSAVLFTANSGTGKSTHTSLWKEHFGAEILNDDSPVIKLVGDSMMAFGTPWSGKTEYNLNVSVPVKALVFLQRSETNFAERISYKDALLNLINGMMTRPVYKPYMDKALKMIEHIAQNIPLYKLGCNISREACEVIKNKIYG